MSVEGPPIERLTHRLAECPAEFLLPPRQIDVAAIVNDLLRALSADPPPEEVPRLLEPGATPDSINRLRLIAVAAWMLYDEWFRGGPDLAPMAWELLRQRLDALARIVPVEGLLKDADRREELARLCLRHLALRPAGETEAQAADRLNTLDSVERLRVIAQTRDAEARARRIREQMARDAAKAAAARYSPE